MSEEPERVVADVDRARRLGFPEVVFGPGKKPSDVRDAARALLRSDARLLVTRATPEQHAAVLEVAQDAEFHAEARAVTVGRGLGPRVGRVSVVTAGTTDIAVAEEAAITAEMAGAEVVRVFDVGIAGLHRILDRRGRLEGCHAHIVVAGMEGALPSAVGGLVPEPVIAVPTSVGYGANLAGLSALLGMLGSCAPGVVVVNIDNGFGAGYAAGRILAGLGGKDPDDRSQEPR